MKTTPLLAALLFAAGASQAATLELEIDGLPSRDGQVFVAVYDSADAWMKKAVRQARVAMTPEGLLRLRLDDLPEGQYALSVLHDANGNNRMDRNVVGMPTEAYGFSNNAAGQFGPPKFEDAKFRVDAAGAVQRIKLQ